MDLMGIVVLVLVIQAVNLLTVLVIGRHLNGQVSREITLARDALRKASQRQIERALRDVFGQSTDNGGTGGQDGGDEWRSR